jgi:hypothetical protein
MAILTFYLVAGTSHGGREVQTPTPGAHRGAIVTIIGEFEGTIFTIDLFDAIRFRRHLNPLLHRVRSCASIQVEAEKNSSPIGPRLNGTRRIISVFVSVRVPVRDRKRDASSSNSPAFDGSVPRKNPILFQLGLEAAELSVL